MPGSYLIDVQRRIVFSRGWGVLTDDEIMSHASTLREDPRFEPTFCQVIDFGDVRELKVTTPGVRSVAQRNPFRPDSRRAVVAPSDEAFGLGALGPALEWIGLDPSTEWPTETPHATFG